MKFLKFILFSLLVISCLHIVSFSYTDTAGTWYEDIVNYATKYDIISGYADSTFRADNNVSKAEAIKLVTSRYADGVAPVHHSQHWAMDYVRYAEQNNIIPTGMYNATNLDQPASRKEICYMLIQACRNIAYKPVLDETGIELNFKDLNEENKENINENGLDYAQAMRLCYAMGIIKGYYHNESYRYTKPDGTTVLVAGDSYMLLKPDENVTRAEAATMVTRTYFSQYREYTYIKRTNDELPSNASDFVETYTYMPKTFYEAGKNSFFKYVPGGKPNDILTSDFVEYDFKSSKYMLDTGVGKARVEGAYDTLYNVSYNMTDDEWEVWKEELQTNFPLIENQVIFNEIDLDAYIQLIKNNKIVIRGGFIVDPNAIGEIMWPDGVERITLKGIATLYVENPNNVDVSLDQFKLYRDYSKFSKIITTSYKQNYVLLASGGIPPFAQEYTRFMHLTDSFYFLN